MNQKLESTSYTPQEVRETRLIILSTHDARQTDTASLTTTDMLGPQTYEAGPTRQPAESGSHAFSSGYNTTLEPLGTDTDNLRRRVTSMYVAGSTVLSPPRPPPCIIDINPQSGPHSTSQRVWVRVENFPRDTGETFFIGFGDLGVVASSFMSSEGDQVQLLECVTPITSTSCALFLSLMTDDLETPMASSDVYYTFL